MQTGRLGYMIRKYQQIITIAACVGSLFYLSGTYHLQPDLYLFKNKNLLPLDSVNGPIGVPFIELDKVDSTNNYAMGQVHEGLASHGQTYFAHQQFAGKGQRGKEWISDPGENIIMSVVIHPSYPNNSQPFLLSALVSLSCLDLLKSKASDFFTIKWPNDLYWGDRKTGGILIENIYRASLWQNAIVGIGINVNQMDFPRTNLNATSLKQITGSTWDPLDLSKELCKKLDARYNSSKGLNPVKLIEEYNRSLFRKDEIVRLRKGNIVFETRIVRVNTSGQLITRDSIERVFEFGEVDWIL